ncbi:hypothetical protein BCR32DRAFT_153195 [Anaeromyces robustus]|uniref:Transmembrane protein n=1 Tax=Anaeromyces robustus TaxID=1754192 RepID=A0A1Y1V0H8_9FUNG|nr:hypothetical protein BCR32DRAFT_153195 [Anaeromyces robustus]|eukprot:ORX44406.1 hypothetical protein BCR32DRAFT_153195 [Anaeromyces robustus]
MFFIRTHPFLLSKYLFTRFSIITNKKSNLDKKKAIIMKHAKINQHVSYTIQTINKYLYISLFIIIKRFIIKSLIFTLFHIINIIFLKKIRCYVTLQYIT